MGLQPSGDMGAATSAPLFGSPEGGGARARLKRCGDGGGDGVVSDDIVMRVVNGKNGSAWLD